MKTMKTTGKTKKVISLFLAVMMMASVSASASGDPTSDQKAPVLSTVPRSFVVESINIDVSNASTGALWDGQNKVLTVPALSDKGETQSVTLEFTAQAIDSSHNAANITNNITWSINPDDMTGVSSSEPQGTNGIFSITVDSTAAKDGEKDVTVTATTSGNKTDTYTFKIKRAESVVTEVKLTEPSSYVPVMDDASAKIEYYANAKDQYGEWLYNQEAIWTITPVDYHVLLIGQGNVIVNKGALAQDYTVMASIGNRVGTATFTVSKNPQSTALSIKDEHNNKITGTQEVTYGDAEFTLIAEGGDGTGAYSLESDSKALTVSGPYGDDKNVFTVHIEAAQPSSQVNLTLTKAGDDVYEKVWTSIQVKVNKKEPTATDFIYIPPAGSTVSEDGNTATLTWDGNQHGGTVTTADGVTGMGKSSLNYKSNKRPSPEVGAPCRAGEYEVYVQVSNDGKNYKGAQIDLNKKIKIEKAPQPTLGVAVNNQAVTDGKAEVEIDSEITVKAPNGIGGGIYVIGLTGNATWGNYVYIPNGIDSKSVDGTFTLYTNLNKGEETLIITKEGDEDTKATTDQTQATVTLIITGRKLKADNFNFTPPDANSLTYDGNPKAATVTMKTLSPVYEGTDKDSLAVSYKNTKDNSTSDSAPTASGTYQVYVDAAGDNYYASGSVTDEDWTFTIAKADPTVNAPTGLTAIYGQTLADVALPNPAGNMAGTWSWADSSASVGNAGTNTFKAIFTPKDENNYNTVSNVDVSVTVSAADPTTPTGLTATYGQTLADVALPAGWAWADSTTSVGNAGTNTFKANYSSTSANYNSRTNVDVTVTVGRANAVAATVTANDRTFDGTEKPLVTVTGTAVGGEMQYASGTDDKTIPAEGWITAIPTGTAAGTYYAWYKVAGDNNHNDTVPACVTVTIAEAAGGNDPLYHYDINTADVAPIPDQTYTGQEIKPTVTVTFMGDPLTEGTDYTVLYANNIDVGEATVFIEGKGDFFNAREVHFKIISSNPAPIDIGKAKISAADQEYTGKEIKPKLTVKLNGKKLKEKKDYIAAFKFNKEIGKATVTITGTGDYTGTATGSFLIVPKKVASPKLTAEKGKKDTLTLSWKAGKGIDGYEIEYGLKKNFKGAKKIKLKGAKNDEYEIKKLTAKKTYYVRIRAWKKAKGKMYYSAWSKTLSKKMK